jgi:glutamate dehydrogenase/leucine dehydrogenase
MKNNAFIESQKQFDWAAKQLNLDKKLRTSLRYPQNFIQKRLIIRGDDGRIKTFTAFRSQYNNALGPFKGGLRFHPEETADTVRALSAWMTWKCSLTGLPLGGGKGGVVCNPKKLSEKELEKISKAYAKKFAKHFGPWTDIPAPDVYTNSQTMAWMLEAYEQSVGISAPGTFTGKPVELGGHEGRTEATGLGVVITTREAMKHVGMNPKKSTAIIQGFGNVGQYAAKHFEKLGLKIIGYSDSSGAIFNKNGIKFEDALKFKIKNKSLRKFPKAEAMSNEQLLEQNCDIFIPAALENVITEKNADKIKAKIIAEGANGPTTVKADEILYNNSIFVIPDLLCNAGGVVGSYFEWVQNNSGENWTLKKYNDELDKVLTNAFQTVVKTYETEKHINMRQAAYLVAVKRVADAMKLRGRV